MDISSSTDQYESWLAAELGSEILKKDLKPLLEQTAKARRHERAG